MAITARSEGHRVLYHWEKLCEECWSALLRDKRIYCSNPDFSMTRGTLTTLKILLNFGLKKLQMEPALKEEYCYGFKDLGFFRSACAD